MIYFTFSVESFICRYTALDVVRLVPLPMMYKCSRQYAKIFHSELEINNNMWDVRKWLIMLAEIYKSAWK